MYIAESIIFFSLIPLNVSYEIDSLEFLGDHKSLTCHISHRPPLRKRIHYILSSAFLTALPPLPTALPIPLPPVPTAYLSLAVPLLPPPTAFATLPPPPTALR